MKFHDYICSSTSSSYSSSYSPYSSSSAASAVSGGVGFYIIFSIGAYTLDYFEGAYTLV